MILSEKRKRYVLVFILSTIFLGIGYYHSIKGIDLTDEGAYVSMPMRYTMGDVPFQDEIFGAPRPAPLLVSYLFKINPDISLRQIRLCGVVIVTIGYIFLYLIISRYIYPFLTAALCLIMFLINNYFGLLSPSYNLLSNNFLSISLALWFFSLGTTGRLKMAFLALLGGIFLGLAVISYPTTIIITSVPLLFILFILVKSKEHKPFILPTAILLLSFFIIMGAALFMLLHHGLLADFIQANKDLLAASSIGSKGLFVKLFDSMLSAWHYRLSPLLAGLLFLPVLFFKSKRKEASKIILPILVAITIATVLVSLYLSIHRNMDTVRLELIFFITLFTLAVLFITSLLNQNDEHKNTCKPSWAIVKNILAGWGIILSLIYAVSSTSASNCIMGIMPLFLICMFSLHKMSTKDMNDAFANNQVKKIGPVLFYLIVAALFYAAFMYNMRYVYRETDFRTLNYPFKHAKLTGIYSGREKVETTEALLSYLDKRVKPNDYFLAYNRIPLLYYLTHTRPAYGTVWISDTYPVELRKKLLDRMIRRGRIPEYCVRMLAEPEGNWKTNILYDKNSPLNLYVTQNYYVDKIIYPFEILRRNNTKP